MKFVALTSLALALAGAPAVAAPPPLQTVLQTSMSMQGFGTDISADGSRYAYIVGGRDHSGRMHLNAYLATLGGMPKRLPLAASSTVDDFALSPSGNEFAFIDGAQNALMAVDTNTLKTRRIARLTGEAQSLHYAPDGRSLAMLYIANPHRRAGATSAGAREVGVIGSVTDEQRLAVVNPKSGAIGFVTPADSYVYEYSWSPDSSRFAFTYAKGNGDNNWWIAELATAAARPGATLTDLYKPPLQMNRPRWSPDGSKVAVIGGLMSDFGPVGGDVYLIDAKSGAATDVTPAWKESASEIRYIDNGAMLIVAHINGSQRVQRLDLTTGKTTDFTPGNEAIGDFAVSRNGSAAAFIRTSFDKPSEVWAGPLNSLKQITHVNEGTPKFYGRARSLNWTNDAFTVQGWLIYPMDFDPAKHYPLVEIIHGGPSSETTPSYDSRFVAALASRGYFVFEPNPRGSFGQGEAFTAANVKDFGYGDWRDDLTGIDAAIKAEPAIDGNRLGIFGWSYGGYMTMWAETQTTRFKAIVSGAGVANWQSYYGQNNINTWMVPFFGASVYDDPAVYAKSSPITFIKNSKTPILILQGERDEEVPAPQAFEFYNAMQALHVPSELMVYADEGHSPRQPANQLDVVTRMVGWFDRYDR